MNQFDAYSNYYDNLYQNKDYRGETKFILNAIRKFSRHSGKDILSFGCGTGTYEILLNKKGYTIVGVDLSAKMLEIARDKANQIKAKIDFRQGDVRKFKINKKFDNVLALFNIVGYQNTNNDLENFIKTAGRHLKSGGLFMFDCWYQPAVLKNRPENRQRIIKLSNGHLVKRTTTQILDIEKSLLHITFRLREFNSLKKTPEVKENHPMRFFTLNEIDYFLKKNNFNLRRVCRFKHLNKPISENNWDMFIIAEKL
ncbi:MAG: class I SAM-dependent methyltransferase [Patescibacteria group bacterium]